MRPLSSLALLLCISTVGCGPRRAADTTTTNDTSTGNDTTTGDDTIGDDTIGDDTTDGTGTDDPDEADDAEENGSLFLPDEPGACGVCDTFAQDCAPGDKCVPGPDLGGSCGPPSCKPVVGDKLPGEPCSVVDGVDDCGANSWCYPAMLEVEGPSLCIEFCSGSLGDPQCSDPDHVCVFDRVIFGYELGCRPRCDPLAPAGCLASETCTLGAHYQTEFGCVVATGHQPPGAGCYANQDCEAGLCSIPYLGDCRNEWGCCASLCNLDEPDCPDELECVPVEVDDPESVVGYCG